MPGDSTYQELWKRLLVYAPELPVPLAQEFINTAYSRALSNLDWYGLRGYGEFRLPAPFSTGTITTTLDSTSVVGVGTAWTSALVGQQLYVGNQAPFYTVVSVTNATNLVLDRPWETAAVAASAYIIQMVYVTCPADFSHFTSIVDIVNRWRLWHFLPQETIDRFDAARTFVANPPYIFAAATPSPVVATADQIRYEVWPRGTGTTTYPYTYVKKLPLLSAATDRPIFPIRGDLIREGALAELALYRGTVEKANPYYDLNAHKIHEARFIQRIEAVKNEDEGVRQSRVWYDDESAGWPMAPLDANFIQLHV